MRDAITLSARDADLLLGLLQELPIRYLGVVQEVQRFLQAKFQDESLETHNGEGSMHVEQPAGHSADH
jgi:hypothetical protein